MLILEFKLHIEVLLEEIASSTAYTLIQVKVT